MLFLHILFLQTLFLFLGGTPAAWGWFNFEKSQKEKSQREKLPKKFELKLEFAVNQDLPIQEALADVKERLPLTIKEQLHFAIPIRINKSLGQTSDGGEVFGRASWGAIEISPLLLKPSNFKTYFKRIIVHEISHLYDDLNVHPPSIQSLLSWCQPSPLEGGGASHQSTMSDACLAHKTTNTTISTTPEFLNIARWFVYNAKGDRRYQDGFKATGPDGYELTDSPEFFAVNMERFLYEPNFACRRPVLYKYFKDKFNHKPFESECQAELNYFYPSDKQNFLKTIELKRVYQVHYLLADAGEDIASRWGHAMFLLVMCSPQRKVVSAECLKDFSHHIVLSFRAFITTPEMSRVAGLFGSYPSRLFFLDLPQVREEYNRFEFRNLLSLPLKLTEAEKNRFVIRALESHWGYDGQYYFLTNNCAVEAFNLLRSVLYENEKFTTGVVHTPKGLQEWLERNQLVDMSVLKDHRSAVQLGHIFESYRSVYDNSFSIIKGGSKIEDMTKYHALPANERRRLFDAHMQAQPQQRIKVAAAYFNLELQIDKLFRRKVMERLAREVLENEKAVAKNKNQETQLKEISRLAEAKRFELNIFSRPTELLGGSPALYGLPMAGDLEVARKAMEDFVEKSRQSDSDSEKIIVSLFTKEERQVMENNQSNINHFIKGVVTKL